MAVAAGVGEPLHEQHAGAFGEARAVGAAGEGLAVAVRGKPALAAELGEGGRAGHHGHAARQREGALAPPQGLRGQVQRDQGAEQAVSTVTAGPSRPRV